MECKGCSKELKVGKDGVFGEEKVWKNLGKDGGQKGLGARVFSCHIE